MSCMKQCIVCGKSFTSPRNRKYCRDECRRKQWKLTQRADYLAAAKRYNKKYWERIKPIHSEKKCEFCGKVFMPNRYTPKQPYCSEKCRVTKYKAENKERVASWKKAERKKHKEKYKETNSAYKDKTRFNGNRIKALERDDFKCMDCGSVYGNLNVHHLDHSGQTANPNHALDNLVTLCAACHLRRHEHWIKTITS